ncbi:MAG: hypothetical protein EZS28_025546 [Streblomastix strix]|uniref:Uncharacterized protein n=1 Tax=Streblomastix strix TaxID=222440 RepID=A0A5J4V8T3_9EUKA|nr:MAG: hypothetical protein EZS28_025546 [Streblomastix strix]
MNAERERDSALQRVIQAKKELDSMGERIVEQERTFEKEKQNTDKILEEAERTKNEVISLKRQLESLRNEQMKQNTHSQSISKNLVQEQEQDRNRELQKMKDELERQLKKVEQEKRQLIEDVTKRSQEVKDISKNCDRVVQVLNGIIEGMNKVVHVSSTAGGDSILDLSSLVGALDIGIKSDIRERSQSPILKERYNKSNQMNDYDVSEYIQSTIHRIDQLLSESGLRRWRDSIGRLQREITEIGQEREESERQRQRLLEQYKRLQEKVEHSQHKYEELSNAHLLLEKHARELQRYCKELQARWVARSKLQNLGSTFPELNNDGDKFLIEQTIQSNRIQQRRSISPSLSIHSQVSGIQRGADLGLGLGLSAAVDNLTNQDLSIVSQQIPSYSFGRSESNVIGQDIGINQPLRQTISTTAPQPLHPSSFSSTYYTPPSLSQFNINNNDNRITFGQSHDLDKESSMNIIKNKDMNYNITSSYTFSSSDDWKQV